MLDSMKSELSKDCACVTFVISQCCMAAQQEGHMQYICDTTKQLRTRTAARKIVLSQGHVYKAERVILDFVFVKHSDLRTHQQKNR